MTKIKTVGIITMASALLVACFGIGTVSAKTTIKMMTHTYQPFNQWISKKIKEYKKIKPNIDINYSYVSHDEFDQKIFVTLASGSAPDILNVYFPTLNDLVRGRFLDQPPANITQDIKSNFITGAWSGMVMEGKLWGYPTEAIMLLPVANEEFFKTAGVPYPTSYEDLLAFQRKLTLKDGAGKIQRLGVTLSTGGLWTMLHWSAQMRSYGGEILSKDGTKAAFNTPEAIKATQFYKELAPTVIPTGGFEKAKVGLVITGSYNRSAWKASAPKLVIKALPALKGIDGKKIGTSYHWGMVVSKTSKHKKEAWDFVHWLNSPVNKLELTRSVEYPPTTKYEIEAYKEDAYMQTFADEFEYGRQLPVVQRYKQVEAEITGRLNEYIYGKILGPDKALSQAEQNVNTILRRNKK